MTDMRQTILHALSVAAERFTENAKELRAKVGTCAPQGDHVQWSQLAAQFETQARETQAAHALLSEGFLCAFSTEGAAFQGGEVPWAVASTLADYVIHPLRHDSTGGRIMCPNGNNIGFFSLDHADEEPETQEDEEPD